MCKHHRISQLVRESELKTDVINNIIDSTQFSLLNTGNDRVVCNPKGKSVVYKMELSPNQNITESKMYNSETELKRYLLPVSETDENYSWIQCPLAEFTVSDNEKVRFLNTLIENFGVVPKDFTDSDIGRVNGKIVLIDYGYGFRSMNNRINCTDEIV